MISNRSTGVFSSQPLNRDSTYGEPLVVPPIKKSLFEALPKQRATTNNIFHTANNATAYGGGGSAFFQNRKHGSVSNGRETAQQEYIGNADLKPKRETFASRFEMMMRKTAQPCCANPTQKLFVDHRKQNQVLISINCSKAVDNEKFEKGSFGGIQENKNDSPQIHQNQQQLQEKKESTLHLPRTSAYNMAHRSMYHVNCSNGSSLLNAIPAENQSNIKNSHIVKQASAMRIDALGYQNYYATEGNFKNSPRICKPIENRASPKSVCRSTNRVPSIISNASIHGHQASWRRSSVNQNDYRISSNLNALHQDKEDRIIEVKVEEFDKMHKSEDLRGSDVSKKRISQLVAKTSESKEQDVNFDDLFPKPINKRKQALMYDRALKQLKTILHSKGIKDSAEVISNNNYDLIHFHIDAGQNNIELNKFDTKEQKLQSEEKDKVKHFQPESSRLFNPKSQRFAEELRSISSTGGAMSTFGKLKNPEYINKQQPNVVLHKQVDESIEYQSSHFDRMGSNINLGEQFENLIDQDYVSDNLIKDSPTIHQKQKHISRGEHFMMQIRSAHIMDDQTSQSSNQSSFIIGVGQQFKFGPSQRTILMSKEVLDTDKDYLNMEIKEFIKLNPDELTVAYNRLSKIINPIYSGSVNTLINKLDPKKAVDDSTKSPVVSKRKLKRFKDLNEIESQLLDELKHCQEKLNKKSMMYGIWSVQNQQGSLPHSREGGAACIVDNTLYVFGGFSRDLFGDMRAYDIHSGQWSIIPNSKLSPHARYSHTMLKYDRKLVLFGGAGAYLQTIKMRLSFNDVHIFDTDQQSWGKEPEIEGAPRKRMSHAASILGGFMIVHGGYNTEQKKLLNDFGIFDLETQKWTNHKLFLIDEQSTSPHQEPKRIDDQHFHYDETNNQVIGFRQMHTMNAIFDEEHYMDTYSCQRLKQKRALWLKKRRFTHEEKATGLAFDEGIYLFGGADQKGTAHNDLWLIEPHYEENEQVLSPTTLDYYASAKHLVSITERKITNFSGRPPCPRIMHSATVFKDWNKHFLLVIYGGRNDQIYGRTQNVALNDICLFNVQRREWVALAMYGQMPCSRWSHCFTLNCGGSGATDGFLVFGGVNLKNYCKSRVYQFQILNQWYRKPNGQEEEVDEKIQMLMNAVKQKTDLIKEILHANAKQQ